MSLPENLLKPIVSEIFTGLIWKIKINDETGLLAIESRDSELKMVSFSVLNFQTGKINFKELSYQEAWNLSLEYLSKDNLLIKGYEDQTSPESKGIISVDAANGAVLWSKFNISLNQTGQSAIQVYDPRIMPRRYFWIDQFTSGPVDPPLSTLPEIKVRLAQPDPYFKLPDWINHGELIGEISALVHNDLTILSFHEVFNKFMQQRLIVYQEDSILLDDILISGIQKLQPEAFFIQKNHLFYIRNKRQLLSYSV